MVDWHVASADTLVKTEVRDKLSSAVAVNDYMCAPSAMVVIK